MWPCPCFGPKALLIASLVLYWRAEADAAPAAAEAGEQEDAQWAAFQEHQRNAARLPYAEEARLLFATARQAPQPCCSCALHWLLLPTSAVAYSVCALSGSHRRWGKHT